MLSSVAERVYWLGRYLERIENSARLLKVYSSMLLDLPRGSHVDWPGLLDISGCNADFIKNHRKMDEESITKFLLVDLNNPVSIFSSLKMARENARTTREIMPSESWEEINDLYLSTKEKLKPSLGRRARSEMLEQIITDCQCISGLFSGSMSHNTAYAFIQLGRKLERADMTTRLVDVGSMSLLPGFLKDSPQSLLVKPYKNVVWMNVLHCLSAYQAYRQNVQNRVNGKDVVQFLLQDEEFPRSVGFCLSELSSDLNSLPNSDDAQRVVSRVKRFNSDVKMTTLLEGGLVEFMDDLQVSIAEIHESISSTWFQHD